MGPPVALQDTAISALSPVAVKPTARKSSAWFCCSVTVCGETTSCAMMELGSVTGCSQLTTIVATASVATTTVQALSRARRAASLCMKVMGSAQSRDEELVHVGRRRRSVGIDRDAERLEREPQQARLLVQRRGLEAALHLGPDHHEGHSPTAMRVVSAGLVERHDQEPVLLELRVREQRSDVGLQPAVRHVQPTVVRVVAEVRLDEAVVRE